MSRTRITVAMVAALAASGCVADAAQRTDGRPVDSRVASSVPPHVEDHPPVHVDSIFPVEESLRRFRGATGEEAHELAGGAPTRDALVARFVDALAASDTAALVDMLLTRAEFAWLYYPHTRFTKRPYELAPEILWLQIQNGASRGLGRLLDRLGGTKLELVGHSCAPVPLEEGPNRLWEECALRVAAAPDEQAAEMRLFGSVLERDGTFKFVSYSNDF